MKCLAKGEREIALHLTMGKLMIKKKRNNRVSSCNLTQTLAPLAQSL